MMWLSAAIGLLLLAKEKPKSCLSTSSYTFGLYVSYFLEAPVWISRKLKIINGPTKEDSASQFIDKAYLQQFACQRIKTSTRKMQKIAGLIKSGEGALKVSEFKSFISKAVPSGILFFRIFYRSPLTLFTPHNTGLFLISASASLCCLPPPIEFPRRLREKCEWIRCLHLCVRRKTRAQRDPGSNKHAHTFNMHGTAGIIRKRDDASQHLSTSEQQTTRETPPSLKTSAERAASLKNREEYKNDDAAGRQAPSPNT